MAPMCEKAKSLPLKHRLRHYRVCTDPRCIARLAAARQMGAQLAAALKPQAEAK